MIPDEEVLYKEGPYYVGHYVDPLIGHVLTCTKVDWSVAEYKRYLPIWGRILEALKSRGIKVVYGLCETDKAIKFNEMFGFTNTGLHVEMQGNNGIRTVMKLVL